MIRLYDPIEFIIIRYLYRPSMIESFSEILPLESIRICSEISNSSDKNKIFS